MSHQVETMAYAGETPWHGLGELVSNDLSPQQMMEKSGCDWTVHEVESFIEFDGKKIPTGQKSLVRSTDGKVLTNVGSGWKPVQNEQAFEFFSEYVMAGDMEMHTAGSLKGGQVVWALAKVKDSFDLFKGDQVDSYLLFSNPHQYGKCIDVRFTPIRVVCNNTLTLAIESEVQRGVRVGHRTDFNPTHVKEALGIAHEKFAKYKEMAEFLGKKKFTASSLVEYYNTVFPRTSDKRVRDMELSAETLSQPARAAFEVLESQPGAEFARGSWWQAFNSVTYMTDHLQGRSQENRLYSSWFGSNQARKRLALNTAIEFADAA